MGTQTICFLAVILAAPVLVALGQTGEPPGIPSASLANRVPAEAALFIELSDLDKHRLNLQKADLWRVVELLAGDAVEKDRANLDWRGLIRGVLEMDPDRAVKELFSQQVALAATGWGDLANAVVITRIRRHSMLDDLNAPGRARKSEIRGRARVVELENGLWIATDGRIAAFCRLGGPDTLFEGVTKLLARERAKPLARSPDFVRWVTSLSRGHAGYLYVSPACRSGRAESKATTGAEHGSSAAADRGTPTAGGAVGMYFRGDRLDFEMWAGRPAEADAAEQPIIEFERLARLPDSTLAVWANAGDIRSGYRRIFTGPLRGPSAPLLALMRDVFDLDVVEEQIISQLGPRMMIVWDRSHNGSNLPELAAMFESADARHTARSMASGLADVASALNFAGGDGGPSEAEGGSALEESEEVGTQLFTVSFSKEPSSTTRPGRAWQLLAMLRPTFAALDGWVIAAASPEHARRIIRAYRGMESTLLSVDDVELDRWRLAGDATELVIAHPAFAAAQVSAWRRGDIAGSGQGGSLLDFVLPQAAAPRVEPIHNRTLGIGVRDDSKGGVEIARVHAREPAVGKLHVGDRIMGVDGELLSLEDPKQDLRRKIAACADPAKLTLRIRRGEELLDVVVPIPHAIAEKAPRPDEMTSLLRNAQILCRRIAYAAYAETRSAPDVFHAQLSLRLTTR